MREILLVVLFFSFGWTGVLEYDLVRMPTQNKDGAPSVLLIGGIQGDEPGGFNACNIFLQHYKILNGNVIVIPNLNKHSILQNHRGIYGDMNRKFSTLDPKDKEFTLIEGIKKLILSDEVDVVFHLHDGSGFYRKTYVDPMLNPNRWGNCVIIDQERIDGNKFGDLKFLSDEVVKNINANTIVDVHKYSVRNTKTNLGNKEMEKTLTYFAIRNKKIALANEASKNLDVSHRVYYHLLSIEGMLNAVGVKWERSFDLSPKNISNLINNKESYIYITPLVKLPVFGLRGEISHFPLPSRDVQNIKLNSNQYIMGLISQKNTVALKYGNRVMTRFKNPLYLEFKEELGSIEMVVDGKNTSVKMGDMVEVKNNFLISPKEGYRANVIGYVGSSEKYSQEMGMLVKRTEFMSRFSIDREGKKYRVEFYKGDAFVGMVIVDFK